MAKKTKCFADGGAIGSDGLTDEQRAKKNAALSSLGISSAPAPVPQPQAQNPAPPPKPQQQGIGSGIIGILKGRQQQVDKAAGYVNGGKIKGAGTPTSDSIDAGVRETGEQIKVSTDERILSKAQDKLLEGLAKSMGYESLDAYLEAGTGKPVGPTIKGGKVAAAGGLQPWYEKDPLASLTESMRSSDKANEQLKSLYPAGTFNDSAKPSSVPVEQKVPASVGFDNPAGVGQKISDIPVPGYQFMTGAKPGELPSSAQGGFTQGNKSYNVNPTSQDGIARVTAKGISPLYTNIDPSQAVTGLNKPMNDKAWGAIELLGRIEDEKQIRGERFSDPNAPRPPSSPNMIDLAGQNDRMARSLGYGGTADFLQKSSGPQQQQQQQGGTYGGEPQITQTDIDNAEKTARWRQDDLIGKLGRGHGSDAAIVAALGANARSNDVAGTNAAQLRAAELNNQAARYGHDINAQRAAENNRVQMRGQDLTSAETAARLGLDKEKLGILQADAARMGSRTALENTKTQGEIDDQKMLREARAGLTSAIASGDPRKIEQARTAAVAAGIKFDKPDVSADYKPDGMGMGGTAVQRNPDGSLITTRIGADGKVAPPVRIAAPGATMAQKPVPAGHMVVGTSGGKRVLQDASGKRFIESE